MELLPKNLSCLSNEESELLKVFEKLPYEIKQEFLLLCKLIVDEQTDKDNTEKDK